MGILLSIKPKYVKEIFQGNKLYEFRRSIFKKKTGKILVYESSPTKRIVGEIVLGNIIEDTPQNLWNELKDFSGINKKDFFKYFGGKEKGFALEIKKFIEYKKPINPYNMIKGFRPPQSFYYMEDLIAS